MKRHYPIIFCLLVFASCSEKQPPADQIIIGKIWTANENNPWAEAIAIAGDSIVSVGNRKEVLRSRGEQTIVTELDTGQMIVPGFIDTHTHFVEAGFGLSSVQLRDTKSKEEFIERIRKFAETVPNGTWITGGDWDHENWGGELPSRTWIDAVTPNHPVWVNRLDGHMAVANSLALRAAGINEDVGPVKGGTFVRDKQNRLTGLVKDNAMGLVYPHVPRAPADMQDRALDAAMSYVAARGVTSIHNMSNFMEVFERARVANRLKTRIYAGMPLEQWKSLKNKIDTTGRGDKWLKIGVLKGFMDGSLGSHTAAFFKPFEDAPGDSGFFITPEEDIYRFAKSADSAGLQVMIHAIGDKAIHTLLNIYDRIGKENGAKDRRFRIEHAQHIAPADISRFGQQKVIASMQPYHAIDDGRWAEKIIGPDRARTTYAFKSLLDTQATLAFGSDWFVAPPAPLEGIYAAVTRRTLDGKNPTGWIPEQKITVEQALKAYTIHAAYASFDERIKGSLEKGKLADLVILDKNILTVAPENIRSITVLKTIVGGQVVYKAR